MRVQDQRKRIFINDMPMKDTEFVVHHGVDGFVDEGNREEMTRCINHQSPIGESRLILYDKWQFIELAIFGAMTRTVN
jgi:hypothetical protein